MAKNLPIRIKVQRSTKNICAKINPTSEPVFLFLHGFILSTRQAVYDRHTDWGEWERMDLEEYLNSYHYQPQPGKKGKRGKPTRSSTPQDKQHWVNELLRQVAERNLPKPRLEYVFHAERKWRFDMDWKLYGYLVAVEIDGGMFSRPVVCHHCGQQVKRKLQSGRMITVREGGRHNSGTGYEKDTEKLNEAALYGWRVLRVTPKSIQNGQALDWIERALM